LLAFVLTAIALFGAAPAVRHYNVVAAPGWARFVWLAAGLQLAYIAWMALAPDWSSVWVVMCALAAVAALYAVGMGILLFSDHSDPLALDLAGVRQTAPGWCAAVTLMTGLGCYLAGRVSYRWHKTHLSFRRDH
jgi:hypothetical protein